MRKKGTSIDIAMLNYSESFNSSVIHKSCNIFDYLEALVPEATFPTQLKQAVLAIQHLFDTWVPPENI